MISQGTPRRTEPFSKICLKRLCILGILLLFVGIGMTISSTQLRDRRNISISKIGPALIIIGCILLCLSAVISCKNIYCNNNNENQPRDISAITSDSHVQQPLPVPVYPRPFQSPYAPTQTSQLNWSQRTYNDPPPPYESVCQTYNQTSSYNTNNRTVVTGDKDVPSAPPRI